MVFDIGDIVRVKLNANWHPNYVGKRFILLSYTTLGDYKFVLKPYQWQQEELLDILNSNIYIKEESLSDLIFEKNV